MKIKTISKTYEEVMALPRPVHRKPCKPNYFLSAVMRVAGIGDLKQVDFSFSRRDMEKAGDGPWLILMNHSSFLDLKIASKILFPKRYNIVCTSDGFVGKELLMRKLGCIPTRKFVTDISLISDINYALNTNKTSVLMYPEASYSFDGTATPLPRKLGVMFKRVRVPVVMITTYGSFARDPLYNNLQKRDVKVSAEIRCLLSVDEVKSKSVSEIDSVLYEAFSFDYWKWQQENQIVIDEPFRADGLERILYRCASCGCEDKMLGKGTGLVCGACNKAYVLNQYGLLEAEDGEPVFEHIPDWYKWERQCVADDIKNKKYALDVDVEIGMIIDYKAVYMIGAGRLSHNEAGFILKDSDGKVIYKQPANSCYSLYSDYFWYEIGDMICIGNNDVLFYCFPKGKNLAAKARIAVEEMYKLSKS
ncbi:MAG: 1-acyl-sn-glycerol-3-phosphate acyltransferase [Clostridia bacterium]|nr:1-acyl-sn-glycerol-3-phosphate acyltransferase [Clostridia bacterium]